MTRRLVPLALALAAFAVPGCGLGPRVIVVVELQTDMTAGIEFTQVRTTVGDEVATVPVAYGDTFYMPGRVAELRAQTGTVRVRVQLLDEADRIRAERLVIVEVRRDTGVVAFISAACRRVQCPGQDQTCIAGTCQGATSICGGEPCRPGDTEECTGSDCDIPIRYCPRGVCDRDCMDDSDCTTFDPCSEAVCESRVCVGIPRANACPPGFYCAIGIGCTDVPIGLVPDAGVPPADASTDVDAGIDYCTTCTTSCGTPGLARCMDGFPTGECDPAQEYCNGQDDDCDTNVDEGLECDHQHAIVCQLGRRMIPGTMMTEPNIVDHFSGGGPGQLCAGGACDSVITDCRTLPGGFDGHRHDVDFGGSSAFSIMDDVPFVVDATVRDASSHSHGARCGLGTTAIEIEGGLAFHRIAPLGLDTEPTPPGRYDQICLAPVGDPLTACYPSFGFCETR